MRKAMRLILAVVLFLTWGVWGCGGSKDLRKEIPPTINTVKFAKGYTKLVAVGLAQKPETAFGQQTTDLYMKNLVDAIKDEDSRSHLVTQREEGFPDFMKALAEASITDVDAAALARAGRQAGYQGLVAAAVTDIHAYQKRAGFLWFRKIRFFIDFNAVVDLYDPCTASKITSKIKEMSVEVSEDEYDAFQGGSNDPIEDFDDEVADAAQDLGEVVGEVLEEAQWRAAVIDVQGDRIILPAGSGAGLRAGDRLAVFEGRRVLEGFEGEQFIAPGFQVDEIQLTGVAEKRAEARSRNPGKVQAGDIVVAIGR